MLMACLGGKIMLKIGVTKLLTSNTNYNHARTRYFTQEGLTSCLMAPDILNEDRMLG